MGKEKAHILVVEDTDNWRLAITMILRQDNYLVFEAATFEEAVDLLGKHRYALAVLDLRLSSDPHNLDGLNLVNQIHDLNSKTGTIMLTAYPDSMQGNDPDVDAFMLKGSSFSKKEFQATARNLVKIYLSYKD